MLPIKNSRFLLNGTQERILQKPESREDTVTVTLGGLEQFAHTMTLSDFEAQTGHYFEGLEPKLAINELELFEKLEQSFQEHLSKVEFDKEKLSLSGEIKFTNQNNTPISVNLYISKQSNGDYRSFIHKKSKWQTMRNQSYLVPAIELEREVNHLAEQAAALTTNKVQILDTDITTTNAKRTYTPDGFAHLHTNESLEDYVKDTKAQGGVVINAKGRFQAFTTNQYPNREHREVHYETKDYATLKGAVKYLAKFGYDEKGRFLDSINLEELNEVMNNEFVARRTFPSSDSEHAAIISTGHSEIKLLKAEKTYSDEKGWEYHYNISITRDSDGASYSVKGLVEYNERGHYTFVHNTPVGHYYELLHITDEDNKLVLPPKEIQIEHHKKQLEYCKSSAKNKMNRLEEYGDNHRLTKILNEELETTKTKIKHHQKALSKLEPSHEPSK
ncbi:hypothetical protein AB4254_11880 [Vibrio breoganii]